MAYTRFIRALEPLRTGAVDLIGDVHGCLDELITLLRHAGHTVTTQPWHLMPAPGRLLIFLGDLTDRGPNSTGVLDLVLPAILDGRAHMVMGNHDWKILRCLGGVQTPRDAETQATLDAIAARGGAYTQQVIAGLIAAPHQIRIAIGAHPHSADGYLTAVHAAAPEKFQDRNSRAAFDKGLYGYPERDATAFGAPPERRDWADEYAGARFVVHGHTPRAAPRLLNRVLCIDTGCVFGGALTLYRVENQQVFSVPAKRDHSGQARALLP